MRKKPHSTALVLLMVCIFAFWWGISILAEHTFSSSVSASASTAAPTENTEPLTVYESSSGQIYTYHGTYAAGDCDSLGSGARYEGGKNGQVIILLTTISSPTNCADASKAAGNETQDFSVSVSVQPGYSIAFQGLMLNGTLMPTQLVKEN